MEIVGLGLAVIGEARNLTGPKKFKSLTETVDRLGRHIEEVEKIRHRFPGVVSDSISDIFNEYLAVVRDILNYADETMEQSFGKAFPRSTSSPKHNLSAKAHRLFMAKSLSENMSTVEEKLTDAAHQLQALICLLGENLKTEEQTWVLAPKIDEILTIAKVTHEALRKFDDRSGAPLPDNVSLGTKHWDSLGFGVCPYDGIFAAEHLKGQVLDLGPLVESSLGYAVRANVNVQNVDMYRAENTTGKGFEDFVRKVRADLCISAPEKILKSSLATYFQYSMTQCSEYYFSRTAFVVQRAQLRPLPLSPEVLSARVIPSVAQFLATESPEKIFKHYGTHVVTGLVVGGTLELWSSSHASQFSSESEFKLATNASFEKLTEGSSSLTAFESSLASRTETTEGLIVNGGKFSAGFNEVEKWAQSVANHAQPIRYLPEGVIPIWELIPHRRQAGSVKKWYEKVFGRTTMILKRFSESSWARYPQPETRVTVPAGWKVISGGATVEYFGHGQLLTKSYPISNNQGPCGWRVQSKDHMEHDPGRVQAHAIAIFDPFNDWDVKVVPSTSGVTNHPSATAALPQDYTLTGGGANAIWKGAGSLLFESYPSSTSTWTASSKDHALSDPSSVVSYAIGVKFREEGYIFSGVVSNSFGPQGHPEGYVSATEGWIFVGGGAKVSSGGFGNMLVNCYPSESGRRFSAASKDHGIVDEQSITVYGIEIEGAVYVQSVREVLGIDPTMPVTSK